MPAAEPQQPAWTGRLGRWLASDKNGFVTHGAGVAVTIAFNALPVTGQLMMISTRIDTLNTDRSAGFDAIDAEFNAMDIRLDKLFDLVEPSLRAFQRHLPPQTVGSRTKSRRKSLARLTECGTSQAPGAAPAWRGCRHSPAGLPAGNSVPCSSLVS